MTNWGQLIEGLLACKDTEESASWHAKAVFDHAKTHNIPVAESDRIIRNSLGYFMGYLSDEDAQKARNLLDLKHPVMPWVGKDSNAAKRMREAFQMGQEIGKKLAS